MQGITRQVYAQGTVTVGNFGTATDNYAQLAGVLTAIEAELQTLLAQWHH
jgi:hypothetical protein